MSKVHLDEVFRYQELIGLGSMVDNYIFWMKKGPKDTTLADFIEYTKNLVPKNSECANLSYPQILYLLGQMMKKQILEKNTKEVEDLLND